MYNALECMLHACTFAHLHANTLFEYGSIFSSSFSLLAIVFGMPFDMDHIRLNYIIAKCNIQPNHVQLNFHSTILITWRSEIPTHTHCSWRHMSYVNHLNCQYSQFLDFKLNLKTMSWLYRHQCYRIFPIQFYECFEISTKFLSLFFFKLYLKFQCNFCKWYIIFIRLINRILSARKVFITAKMKKKW